MQEREISGKVEKTNKESKTYQKHWEPRASYMEFPLWMLLMPRKVPSKGGESLRFVGIPCCCMYEICTMCIPTTALALHLFESFHHAHFIGQL